MYAGARAYKGATVTKSVKLVGVPTEAYGLPRIGVNASGMGWGIVVTEDGRGSRIVGFRFEVENAILGKNADKVYVTQNTIVSPGRGISIEGCNYWTITENTIRNIRAKVKPSYGINIESGSTRESTNNLVCNNSITGKVKKTLAKGIEVGGIRLYGSQTGANVSSNGVYANKVELEKSSEGHPNGLKVIGIHVLQKSEVAVPCMVLDNEIRVNALSNPNAVIYDPTNLGTLCNTSEEWRLKNIPNP